MDYEDNYIDIQHDFYHTRDTRVILQEDDRMQPYPPLSSSYRDEIDIISFSSPEENSQRILRHVQKSARDMCSVILHRISKFSHVEYELQRTIVSDCDCGGRIPLDIRCPSNRRIRDDRLDQAFQHIFDLHGDLQCLRRFSLRAFSVLPSY